MDIRPIAEMKHDRMHERQFFVRLAGEATAAIEAVQNGLPSLGAYVVNGKEWTPFAFQASELNAHGDYAVVVCYQPDAVVVH